MVDVHPWLASYDPGVPPRIEFQPLTLPAMLDRSAARFSGRPAIIFMNCRLTYGQLRAEVDRMAAALARLGVEPGSRVAIQLPNIPQLPIAFFAVQQLGAQCVMTNPLYVPREIEHQWTDACVDTVVCTDFIYEQKLRNLRGRLPAKHYIVASIPDYLRFPLRLLAPLKLKRAKPVPLIARIDPEPGVQSFRDALRNGGARPPAAEIDIGDVACLQYTGGTTGVSKGAMLTHSNMSWNVQQAHAWFPELSETDIFLASLPFFHVFGLTVCLLLPVYLGACMVLLPNPRDIPLTVKTIVKHRITMVPTVPAILNGVNRLRGIERADLSCVKYAISGSAPLPGEVQQRFQRLTGAQIVEGFGMTESSPITHASPLHRLKEGTIGVPLPDTDARVVDIQDGATGLPIGQPGELVIRGPQVMKGYWGKPEETARTLRGGWLHTGDVAAMDEEGYFRIVGRIKDMIIAGGYNIYPDEIDEILLSHPAVLEAATIGVPDECRGETVKSFIVFRPGQHASFEELRAHCKQNLAPFKVPRLWEERSELPKSSVMKVLRRALREEHLATQGRAGQ